MEVSAHLVGEEKEGGVEGGGGRGCRDLQCARK